LYGGKTALKFEVNLQTVWQFKTGDDLSRKDPGFDDSRWDDIIVPGKWEDQGYRNYDGFAWYRKSFVYQGNATEDKMVIVMGKIDDFDQVYINGTLVGLTGNFPSNSNRESNSGGEYDAFRGYYFAASLLKKGQKNVVSVRVYDHGGEGGIYEGPVGIITQTKYIEYWRSIKKSNR
jgi:hypothetical protein